MGTVPVPRLQRRRPRPDGLGVRIDRCADESLVVAYQEMGSVVGDLDGEWYGLGSQTYLRAISRDQRPVQ